MTTIPLTQGLVALVDDEDYPWLVSFNWCAARRAGARCNYAVRRTIQDAQGASRILCMHRQIMGEPVGFDVDHRNGDGLDCRRGNLRIATRCQNARNQRRLRLGKTSRFKGVSQHETNGRWRATIRVSPTRREHLGYFGDEVSAALAYDVAARHYFGEFAAPNFERTVPCLKII